MRQKVFGPSAHLCTNTGPDQGFNQRTNSNHHYREQREGPTSFDNTHTHMRLGFISLSGQLTLIKILAGQMNTAFLSWTHTNPFPNLFLFGFTLLNALHTVYARSHGQYADCSSRILYLLLRSNHVMNVRRSSK